MTTVAATSANSPPAHLWQPGQSGNPSGRPKSFANVIRERTNNGEDAVNLALSIMAGESIDGEKPNLKLRFQAMEWVVDRGWGKAVAVVEHSGSIGLDVSIFDGTDNAALKLIVAAAKVLNDESSQAVVHGEMTDMSELEAHDDGTQTV